MEVLKQVVFLLAGLGLFLYSMLRAIDFVDENKAGLFWQAVSESSYNPNASPEQREKQMKAIVEKVLSKYPPKKINHFYGYRTSTSMRSQEIWDFSQQYSADKIQRLGGLIILLGAIAFFINVQQLWAVWIGIALVTLLPVLLIIQIEKELKRRFPKD